MSSVILNSFQDLQCIAFIFYKPEILKQVQDDRGGVFRMTSGGVFGVTGGEEGVTISD